jgi:integral membrane protein
MSKTPFLTPANLNRLSFIEGLSLLLLMGVAMPIKYLAGDPSYVRVIGAIHGGLFLVFVAGIAYFASKDNWGRRLTVEALVSSSIPFGMFYFAKKLKEFYKRSAPAAASSPLPEDKSR